MSHSRSQHSSVIIDSKLFVIGGATKGSSISMLDLEILEDGWQSVVDSHSSLKGTYCPLVVAINSFDILIGGGLQKKFKEDILLLKTRSNSLN